MRKLYRYLPEEETKEGEREDTVAHKYHLPPASSRINQTFSNSHCTNCINSNRYNSVQNTVESIYLPQREKSRSREEANKPTNNYSFFCTILAKSRSIWYVWEMASNGILYLSPFFLSPSFSKMSSPPSPLSLHSQIDRQNFPSNHHNSNG